jgi:hypothetical protein
MAAGVRTPFGTGFKSCGKTPSATASQYLTSADTICHASSNALRESA